jgi:crotonobetainyl-CoA:carnitine CoA-transferase CaiB-like acyl-CoA transferase
VLPKDLFSSLTVLELSSVLAGPLAGSFFAELGAVVTKVENKKTGGDVTRQWKLPEEDPSAPAGAYYYAANYGKEVVFLDFNHPEDYIQLNTLIESHDIILSNFQKKVAEKFDLCPESLHKKYPEKIILQLNAYNYDDPRPGFDLIMQAETGFISMNGTEEGFLCKMPVAMIDIMASHQIREAALIALFKKEKTGKGSLVHISLYQAGIASLANQASNYLMAGHIAKPMGTLHPNIAPYGDLFYSEDKIFFFLGVGSDNQFKKLWKTLNFSEANFVKFLTNFSRLTNRTALQKELQTVFSQKTFKALSNHFRECDVPYAEIKNMEEVFENPLSKQMILHEEIKDGMKAFSVSNIAFLFVS